MSKANTRVIDLPTKQNPTGAEQVYIATETMDEKISLAEIRGFFGETFLQKSENLSDIDAESARENLGVYSKTEVDEKNTEQDERLSVVETKNEEQDERLVAVEAKNAEQDGRLSSIEAVNTVQHTNIANKIDRSDAEAEFAAKSHTHTVSEVTDFTEKTFEILQEKIIAGQNVTITQEGGKIKITSTGGGSGGGGGDMLKSIYDTDNDGKVDVAKVAESVTWNVITGKPATFTASPHTHTKNQITDFPTSMPASDVHSWAKQANKPSYNWNEIQQKPETFTPDPHHHYIEVNVDTAYNIAAKVGTTANGGYTPQKGDILLVNFVNGTQVAYPTLNIDGSGAKNIRAGYYNVSTNMFHLDRRPNSNIKVFLWYDGEYYQMFGAGHNNTYGEIPEAEIANASLASARLVSGRRLSKIKEHFEQNVPTPTQASHAVNKGYIDQRMDSITINRLTQQQYDSLAVKDPNTLYIVT